MSQIVAKKLIVILKNGSKVEYTHVTKIRAEAGGILLVEGKTDDIDGSRYNAVSHFNVDEIHITWIEWYKPPE